MRRGLAGQSCLAISPWRAKAKAKASLSVHVAEWSCLRACLPLYRHPTTIQTLGYHIQTLNYYMDTYLFYRHVTAIRTFSYSRTYTSGALSAIHEAQDSYLVTQSARFGALRAQIGAQKSAL